METNQPTSLPTQTRYCNKCYDVLVRGENWPEYYVTNKMYTCKPCKLKYTREWKAANPDSWKLRTYGLTQEEYLKMLEKQNDSCAICRTSNAGGKNGVWQIDHDHETGKVRGLLCWPCNAGLGQFKDNTEFLRSAAKYLEDTDEDSKD